MPANINVQDAIITWDEDDNGFTFNFQVQSLKIDGYASGGSLSSGAVFSDWMGEDPCKTPAGLFAVLDDQGFRSRSERIGALKDLSKIEGCDWAAQMATALERLDD